MILRSVLAALALFCLSTFAAGAGTLDQVKARGYLQCGSNPGLAGFGLPDDNLHAPNEKFHLPNFYRGIDAVGRFLELAG